MQLLEFSIFGLRSARLVFRRAGSSAAVTLFPLIHVAEARFYEETYADPFSHDVVLAEGVHSSATRNLTRAYRWVNVQKLGLMVQPKYPPQEAVGARIVKADLTTLEFEATWRKVPLSFRAFLAALAPCGPQSAVHCNARTTGPPPLARGPAVG